MAYIERYKHGFTIVELLIVVVVIAILASISVVAYNGIQQRSRNTQVISGVNQYYKAVLQYAAVKSVYPNTNSNACLGANYPSDKCWDNPSGGSNYFVVPAVDTNLSEFIQIKPTLATTRFSIGISDNNRAGLLYNGTQQRFVWYLEGIYQGCGLSGASANNEGGVVTQCNILLPTL